MMIYREGGVTGENGKVLYMMRMGEGGGTCKSLYYNDRKTPFVNNSIFVKFYTCTGEVYKIIFFFHKIKICYLTFFNDNNESHTMFPIFRRAYTKTSF